jgi:hypothetical protein
MIRDFISDPDLDFLPIPNPRGKRYWIPDPQHCIENDSATSEYLTSCTNLAILKNQKT